MIARIGVIFKYYDAEIAMEAVPPARKRLTFSTKYPAISCITVYFLIQYNKQEVLKWICRN